MAYHNAQTLYAESVRSAISMNRSIRVGFLVAALISTLLIYGSMNTDTAWSSFNPSFNAGLYNISWSPSCTNKTIEVFAKDETGKFVWDEENNQIKMKKKSVVDKCYNNASFIHLIDTHGSGVLMFNNHDPEITDFKIWLPEGVSIDPGALIGLAIKAGAVDPEAQPGETVSVKLASAQVDTGFKSGDFISCDLATGSVYLAFNKAPDASSLTLDLALNGINSDSLSIQYEPLDCVVLGIFPTTKDLNEDSSDTTISVGFDQTDDFLDTNQLTNDLPDRISLSIMNMPDIEGLTLDIEESIFTTPPSCVKSDMFARFRSEDGDYAAVSNQYDFYDPVYDTYMYLKNFVSDSKAEAFYNDLAIWSPDGDVGPCKFDYDMQGKDLEIQDQLANKNSMELHANKSQDLEFNFIPQPKPYEGVKELKEFTVKSTAGVHVDYGEVAKCNEADAKDQNCSDQSKIGDGSFIVRSKGKYLDIGVDIFAAASKNSADSISSAYVVPVTKATGGGKAKKIPKGELPVIKTDFFLSPAKDFLGNDLGNRLKFVTSLPDAYSDYEFRVIDFNLHGTDAGEINDLTYTPSRCGKLVFSASFETEDGKAYETTQPVDITQCGNGNQEFDSNLSWTAYDPYPAHMSIHSFLLSHGKTQASVNELELTFPKGFSWNRDKKVSPEERRIGFVSLWSPIADGNLTGDINIDVDEFDKADEDDVSAHIDLQGTVGGAPLVIPVDAALSQTAKGQPRLKLENDLDIPIDAVHIQTDKDVIRNTASCDFFKMDADLGSFTDELNVQHVQSPWEAIKPINKYCSSTVYNPQKPAFGLSVKNFLKGLNGKPSSSKKSPISFSFKVDKVHGNKLGLFEIALPKGVNADLSGSDCLGKETTGSCEEKVGTINFTHAFFDGLAKRSLTSGLYVTYPEGTKSPASAYLSGSLNIPTTEETTEFEMYVKPNDQGTHPTKLLFPEPDGIATRSVSLALLDEIAAHPLGCLDLSYTGFLYGSLPGASSIPGSSTDGYTNPTCTDPKYKKLKKYPKRKVKKKKKMLGPGPKIKPKKSKHKKTKSKNWP